MASRSSGKGRAPADAEQDKPLDGVFVQRVALEDGVNFGFNVVPMGDVRPTEIGDILAYGLRNHRKLTDPE